MSKKQILFTSLGVVIIAAILISIYFLFLKPCDHEWLNATCENPATCKLCGETEGEPLERTYVPSYSSSSSGSSSVSSSSNESSGFKYGCSISGCPYPAKCVNGTYGSYCEFHGCQVPGCLNTPIGGSYYCATHIDNH